MKARLGSIYKRGSIWWIKFYHNGRPFRESSGSENYQDAERLLKRRQGEIAVGRFAGLGPERIRVRDLLNMVLDDYRVNERRTVYEVALRITRHLIPFFGDLRAADFSTLRLKRYIAERRAEGARNATINRELSIVRRGFRLAAQSDPPKVAYVPHIPKLEENNIRESFLEYDQYLALREALPVHLRCLFVVGYHLGCRLGELRSLRRDQVHLDAGEIQLDASQTKTKRPRVLPIYGDMEFWLRWQLEDLQQNWPECPWLFHYQGRRIGGHLKGWKQACQQVGLAGLLFHDLRRTAIRNMVRAGIPEKVCMEISGHTTRSTFDRYNIVSRRDLLLVREKMDSYLARVTGSAGTISGTISEGKLLQ
jgi:integrase